ncbi:sugar diacid recognition domain-containing protein [Halalkalibacter lacteus]|uniref:sugar diacid recognition domain-containing protein n=1 Tax=Halalkalibacter lacteus TaxID=3090663 RepID=UPI002FC874AD
MAMYVTEQVAQEIVDRTMAILPYNINVMDQDGRIIGSGDRRRILTKHEVASEVLKRKEIIEINHNDTQNWDGVKEGINLPIVFQGEVVGVVGITGDPEVTRGYGQLVKMTTEMIIEQAFLQKQLQLDERIKEELVHQLINGNNLGESLVFEKAKSLQIDLMVPRVVIVFKCSSQQIDRNQKLEQKIQEMKEKDDLTGKTYTGEMVILKKVAITNEDWEKERTLNTIRIWLSQLQKIDPSVKLAIGSYYSTFKKLHQSYKEAQDTLVIGEKLVLEQSLLLYEDFSKYVFINELAQSMDNPFIEVINKLKGEGLGDLQRTLEVYINQNGRAINTSNELFIHRNSLQYRLEKIKEITGKDPRNYKDLFELYLSIIIDKFTSRKK